jgi:hypothetical protein
MYGPKYHSSKGRKYTGSRNTKQCIILYGAIARITKKCGKTLDKET